MIQVPFAQAYTGTITYSAGTDSILIVGGNSTIPITFEDIYLADVAGGWNQVTKQGSSQYHFTCNLLVGNTSTTYFTDTKKQVTFASGVAAATGAFILCYANSYFTLGTLIDATQKLTSSGCAIYSLESATSGVYLIAAVSDSATINLYSSQFAANRITGIGYYGTWKMYNSQVTNNIQLSRTSGTWDIYNVIISAVSGYAGLSFLTGSFDTLYVSGCSAAMAVGSSGNLNVSNAKIRNCTYIFSASSSTADSYLINADSSNWGFSWTGTSTSEVYRQYTYELIVLNGEITEFVENANVTLSKGGVQIGTWLTNSSGQIPPQILTYGYYNQTGGDTMYDGSYPFVLTVTHPDWSDYTSRFYVTEKTKMTISMQDTTTVNNAAIIWSLLFGSIAFGLFLLWRKAHA